MVMIAQYIISFLENAIDPERFKPIPPIQLWQLFSIRSLLIIFPSIFVDGLCELNGERNEIETKIVSVYVLCVVMI